MTIASRACVRALFAAYVVRGEGTLSVGGVVLHDSQREAVRRGRSALSRFGGVLLADDVGTGKTYVALALAAAYVNPLVLAPATLRGMWADAARRAALTVSFASIESLSRGSEPPAGHDAVIVDESHHLRNPGTRRYALARELLRGSDAILLSATPVHNRAGELDAQLALFLGIDASDLDEETRAHAIVRTADSPAGPSVVVHPPIRIPDVERVLDAIRSLPPPAPPRDGGDAPALARIGLLRAWCSSRDAAARMAHRAWNKGSTMLDYLDAGVTPGRRDLRAWFGGGEDQLALVALFAEAGAAALNSTSARAYVEGTQALWRLLESEYWIDDERARQLREIVATHPGVPVLACSQYTATVEAMWSRLRMMPGVAALTSKGARIVSGPIGRDEALARFAPRAIGARSPHERDRIELLIATDLVSEGLNLHDAGVLVHLDLPWTAARLAQRVGRIARKGSPHGVVHTYSLSPPRAAAALLSLERRIAIKRRIAAELVGGISRTNVLLGRVRDGRRRAAPESFAHIVHLLRPWVEDVELNDELRVCGVEAPQRGWLALASDGRRPRLIARIGKGAPSTRPSVVVRAVDWLVSAEEHWLPATWDVARREAARWMDRERGRELAGVARPNAARAQQRALATTMAAIAGSSPHQRVSVASGAADVHRENPRHAAIPASLVALVVFCRRDDPCASNRSPLRS